MSFRKAAIGVSATLVWLAPAWGGGLAGLRNVSRADAERALDGLEQTYSPAAMWIWSDKYVYRAGEQLTLRWTLKPNNDLFPYSFVCYRVNNQTGARTFYPSGTAEATDIFGQTIAQGFRIFQLGEAIKQTLLGPGGAIGGVITIPNELGMHTIVVEMRDFTGTRVVKSAYQKIGVVDGEVSVSGDITSNTTWVNTRLYRIAGLTFVKNATLTIEPGTFVIGNPGTQPPTAILITRSGRIVAEGTRTSPIIMTSSRAFGERAPQDWGGLVMLGRARANIPGGEEGIEGLPRTEDTTYGGTDDTHDCGSLRYVRIEFAGVPFQPNQEINSFTWGGCGSRSKAEFLQAHYGFDDAFEWFGGTVDAKYLVATYGRDDAIDWQLGWRGRVQHAVVVGNDDLTNMGIEADNLQNQELAEPISDGRIWNVTFVGAGNRGADETNASAIFLRRGTRADINNVIALAWSNFGLRVVDAGTLANLANGNIKMNGVLLWNNGALVNPPRPNTLDGQVEAGSLEFARGNSGQGRQFLVIDPRLRRPFERSNPDFRPLPGSPVFRANWIRPPADGFFDQWATYIGAFGDYDWTEEWTNFLQEEDIKLP
jgi:hypothetical protein